jgi:hypothetical protein
MFLCRKWGMTDIQWNLADWKWSECQLVSDIIQFYNRPGIDASKIYKGEEQFWIKDHEKKNRLIRLICKVKNEKYDESKEVRNDIKINIDDVKLVVKTVSGIDLDIKY